MYVMDPVRAPNSRVARQGAVSLLIVAVLLAALPGGLAGTAAADLPKIDGGESKSEAPVLEKGQEYRISDGWYKVYVENPGSVVRAMFSNAYIDNDDPQFEVRNNGTELRYQDWSYTASVEDPSRQWVVKRSGYVFVHVSGGNLEDGSTLAVITGQPDEDIFQTKSVSVTPAEVTPDENTTIQARITYTRTGSLNAEVGKVTVSVDGETVDTTRISPEQGATATVTTVYNPSAEAGSDDRTVTVRVAPTWTDVDSGTQGQTTLTVDAADLDSDGLFDYREEELGTDPQDPDTDNDGLADGRELELGTEPTVADTDGDGLTDGRELELGTEPTVADTDGDGLTDGRELEVGSNATVVDTDGDGLDDPKEVKLGTDPAKVDTDGDGLDDKREFELGTDPLETDSDGDGLPDPRELEIGTDPTVADTDGDGYGDGEEITQGTDPTEKTDADTNATTRERSAREDSGSGSDPGSQNEGVLEQQKIDMESDQINLVLRGEKTIARLNEDAVLQFGATNLISNDRPMTVQLILETPSGVSVTNSAFSESGIGQYTATYTLTPGDSKGLEIGVRANEPGRFGITGHAVYYFGENKSTADSRSVTIPVKVLSESQSDGEPSSDDQPNGILSVGQPGVGALGALAALAVAFLLRTRRGGQ